MQKHFSYNCSVTFFPAIDLVTVLKCEKHTFTIGHMDKQVEKPLKKYSEIIKFRNKSEYNK